MKEFYQSPAFLNAVAASTVALIGILFIIGLHPFKRKKRMVLATPENLNYWMAGDYFKHVKALIVTSRNLKDLEKAMPLIEGFSRKQYRESISRQALKEYYNLLLEEYYQKELGFDMIPVEICPN